MSVEIDGLRTRSLRRVRVLASLSVLVLIIGLVGTLPLWITLGMTVLLAGGAAYLHWFTRRVLRDITSRRDAR